MHSPTNSGISTFFRDHILGMTIFALATGLASTYLYTVLIPDSHRTGRIASDSQVFTEQEARDFVHQFLEASNRANPIRLLEFYADYVDYFGEGSVDKEFIYRDKQAYYKRWPKVSNALSGDIKVHDLDDPATRIVSFLIEFRVSSPARGAGVFGTAENVLQLRRIDGKIKILDEKQKVLSRNR